MNNVVYTAFLLILLSSCAKPQIDGRFAPYVNEWNQDYPDAKVNVSILFGTPDPACSGSQCSVVAVWDGSQITVDEKSWNILGHGYPQKQLIYHELGHAMFNYQHDIKCIDPSNPDAPVDCTLSVTPWTQASSYIYIPRSIMYPYVFGAASFYEEWDAYYTKQLPTCETCNYNILAPMLGDQNYQVIREVVQID